MKKIYKLFYLIRGIFYKTVCLIVTRNSNVLRCNINYFSTFNGKEEFGVNVNFNGCKVYGKGVVKFGDNFHSAKGLVFLTTFHNYNGESIPYDNTVITKDIIIEDNVWIGMNVIILGGVIIGEGAIIQAGSVVSKSISKLGIAGGNPAKVFKERNAERYWDMKLNERFL